ncbi:sterile alpha motif domain-containing protein 9-like isoform X1 [Myxocyprinus asiaticus]|uniref:sterile alpha motif domain-containing protein 9-like isoform X1 n=1 Tax=Myxocyprinus asiaticus TaxID=70543 RepID=UPI002221BE5D|nr:sterile alpha motif domain-containing protein 9-like isoform X1 [Myxocyprinus asiaticus]XP_051570265.1 sterile alpha motif domain-containing protein 9-like isoform X1 [Myxocyprinus asiaticus]XP_051570266.1 sterile alpha motif domain-containing protein 9-like isoform X1 [Myxocyprinus asiaticus]XP_051570267.1 sterile alpha motif domain-containing protein 9-like isoform X1 [Myxocyprinus asiaticus]XP_051570268.1 sterile alpha motif domain-containing protein 9-like isoform X2 [Myxocyprinus asiati
MEKPENSPIETWTESVVSDWLRSIEIKETYIEKLHEEEVNGRILLEISEEFLKRETGIKSGPALLIINKRDELVNLQRAQKNKKHVHSHKQTTGKKDHRATARDDDTRTEIKEKIKEDTLAVRKTKRDTKPRPFGKEGVDFTYVKNDVLFPESGVIDLINPCHEYKSFAIAATLDRQRLQAKFANEVFAFATGCMNIRSNGTIHFGIMDSREDRDGTKYVHGEIIGIPVEEKDMYTDALDHMEKSFKSDKELVRQCIRPPQFIQVVSSNSNEEHHVVEVDIEPSVSIVRNKVFSVCLPNFNEKANKVHYEKEKNYCRVGSKTEPVDDLNEFYQRVRFRDTQREEAEARHTFTAPELCQDLGKKLIMLMTSGKKIMDKDKWHILVTNPFQEKDIQRIDFLLNMNIFCVFEFDPDSMVSGLCHEYQKHHAVNLHFLQNYKIPSGMSIREFESHLHLFDQTSWIFCNGRSDFKGNEPPCDEKTWVKTKRTLLKDCVSLICKDMLPKGTFQVIFLLTAPVDTPFLNTFYEFITDMQGHEDIICLAESEANFKKWQAFALQSCDMETVNNSSVVGMKISHINATLQSIQPVSIRSTKRLPIYVKGECCLDKREEEIRCSLEILSVNHCEETSPEFVDSEKDKIEQQFYHGGKVTWMNLWLADQKYIGEVIQRDAFHDVTKFVKDSPKWGLDQTPISSINIYHHPGSGGSTVARQVLWNNRKDLRCAVVKTSYPATVVAEDAVWFREYEEKDPQKCLPVLLLFEDCDQEYLYDVKNELEVAVNTKKIARGTLCFIMLCCQRCHNPEKMCKKAPLQNVPVTHKLSKQEKMQFSAKRQKLEKQFQPEFILTFVLMSEEFESNKIAAYVKKFVTHLLQGIDHASVVTQLVRYVALLNTYVQNSFISRSHCEEVLALSIHMDRFRQHTFETSLSDQAKLVLIHLKDEKSHIECIRIIHPLVAKEILHQLLDDKQQQSDIALDLLNNEALFGHRFGKYDYMKFLRDLFMRRCKIIKGDKHDSFFSPLIEHVADKECSDKAIELLKEAYKRFDKDAFFAQQLARLNYRHERFEDAEYWAEIAATKMPKNSYILDTRGQVYRWWFSAKCKALDSVNKTPENTTDAVKTALKAIECFKACEEAAISDNETMNNAGFFGVIEVGCSLLKLIASLHVFSNRNDFKYVRYLQTDFVPEEIEKPWEQFHSELKNLRVIMLKALEWISEDLSYFQTDLVTDEEKTSERTILNPRHWLVSKSSVYGQYFCTAYHCNVKSQASLTPLMKQMMIYQHGGGTITTIFSHLTDQKDSDAVSHRLERIISFYPSNPKSANMPQGDIVNYIASHFALSCVSAQSSKVAAFQDLQKLSLHFPNDRQRCLSNALFLLVLLWWPEEHDNEVEKEQKYETVLSAVEHLQRNYDKKLKDIPQRKKRIYTHFFLSNGVGFQKYVHKSKVEQITKQPSVSEKRLKWLSGEVWKMPEISKLLRRVTGWTEDERVYLEGPKTRFRIPALNISSVPHSNENVTFYLGFTLRGPVAYNITVRTVKTASTP